MWAPCVQNVRSTSAIVCFLFFEIPANKRWHTSAKIRGCITLSEHGRHVARLRRRRRRRTYAPPSNNHEKIDYFLKMDMELYLVALRAAELRYKLLILGDI